MSVKLEKFLEVKTAYEKYVKYCREIEDLEELLIAGLLILKRKEEGLLCALEKDGEIKFDFKIRPEALFLVGDDDELTYADVEKLKETSVPVFIYKDGELEVYCNGTHIQNFDILWDTVFTNVTKSTAYTGYKSVGSSYKGWGDDTDDYYYYGGYASAKDNKKKG